MKERNQTKQRIENIHKVFDFFKQYKGNIPEISKALGIPKSTIQRYVNSIEFEELFRLAYPNESPDAIKEHFRKMKEQGNQQGGINTQEKYGFEKDAEGKFQGSRKK